MPPATRSSAGVGGSNATYGLHGLVVESELPLDAPPASGPPDYRLRLGEPRAASGAPAGRLLGELHVGEFSFWCVEDPDQPEAWLLRYGDLGDVELDRRTRELTVFPVPGRGPEVLGALVGGSILSLLLSADGEMVLHASAVEVGGSVLAMIGAPGAGKSTLAALLCAHGARLVSDDALRVAPGEEGRCYLGTDVARLRAGASELAPALGGAESFETVDGRVGVIPARPPADAPLRLAAVLVPRPSRTARRLELERLAVKEALIELFRNPRVISWREQRPHRAYFEHANVLARTIPIYRAVVPWGPPFAPGLAGRILDAVGLGGEVE